MEDIMFDEANHKYYDKVGRNYTSVTTLIGRYTEEFDTEFWSMFTALREKGFNVKPQPESQKIVVGGRPYTLKDLQKDTMYKMYQDEVKLKWKIKTQEACNRGNATHNELEDSINLSKGGSNNQLINNGGTKKKNLGTIHDLDSTGLKEKYPEVYQRLGGYINMGCTIFSEKRVFLEEFLIAGMIDVPIIKGKSFVILDWKTNEGTLHKTAGYYKKKMIDGQLMKTDQWIETGKKFNYPLDMLEASKFNVYAMQLSLYAYILEQWGYTLVPDGLEIVHFPMGHPPRLLKMPYLREEVIIMLNHHKQQIQNTL